MGQDGIIKDFIEREKLICELDNMMLLYNISIKNLNHNYKLDDITKKYLDINKKKVLENKKFSDLKKLLISEYFKINKFYKTCFEEKKYEFTVQVFYAENPLTKKIIQYYIGKGFVLTEKNSTSDINNEFSFLLNKEEFFNLEFIIYGSKDIKIKDMSVIKCQGSEH